MEREHVPSSAEQQRAEQQRAVLPAEPASAGVARDFVRRLVRRSRHRALEDAAVLCVTELVANVSVHTGSSLCTVTVVDEPDDLLIEVADEAPQVPALASGSPDAEFGRGLRIIDALADEWGVNLDRESGKSIWLRLCDR